MPIHTDTTTLQQVIDPVLDLRDDSECCIDVGSEEIRLQALSEDWTVYLDYTIPSPPCLVTDNDVTDSFWFEIEKIDEFLTASKSKEVVITLPVEEPDYRAIFESDGLRYQAAPLDDTTTHPLLDSLTVVSDAVVVLQHGAFRHAVTVADLVGEQMRVDINPAARQLEFSANTPGEDAFAYLLRSDRLNDINGSQFSLNISIEFLRDFVSHIPESSKITIKLTHSVMVYHVEHPITGAVLTLFIAERTGSIR